MLILLFGPCAKWHISCRCAGHGVVATSLQTSVAARTRWLCIIIRGGNDIQLVRNFLNVNEPNKINNVHESQISSLLRTILKSLCVRLKCNTSPCCNFESPSLQHGTENCKQTRHDSSNKMRDS